ncbi:antibiotic biosynthesis monooxygenase [Levilactobacillus brevis]|uniref:Monooxygenase n=3 Tax=Levilactobacillus brevis TaxID=1580 RepID=Q03R94_LEVBA|nr:antibiotic biosynthesis monooxygenase [Levilactobacillus brevis]MBL3537905.1 antibiotic biosynthesis monooxygenase [Lactobacillus sp. GPR40-2]MBL3631039.1 antibiotic biosynthesis monooxygenase [Lactobacillus sp. GPB7-4]ABJ64278.1 Monooxygenase [Levilactobacillus brevis ATCC 367]AJA80781.1 hypothetical protein L747_03645 [Levilactobacillus brevis BSO 464]ARW21815.1 hypothetical protein S101174_00972 [Levilactobacillus brevis]
MRHELSLTFGSRDVLQRIIQENTDRHLLLLAGSATDEGLLLLDVSGTPSIFTGGLTYQIRAHQGSQSWQGFFSFDYFTLDPDTAKVFEAKVNRLASPPLPAGMTDLYLLTKQHNDSEYLLLTVWQDSQAYALWRHSPAFAPIDTYATSANHFHAASYHQVPKKEPQG